VLPRGKKGEDYILREEGLKLTFLRGNWGKGDEKSKAGEKGRASGIGHKKGKLE